MKNLAALLGWAFLVAGMLGLTGCQEKAETVRIGLAGVQTGQDGQIGTPIIFGAQIAIEEWNACGGVLGKMIEPVIRDDEGKPAQAVAVANELVSQEVAGVIGHFNSGCTLPASEIYHAAKVLQLTPCSTNPQVTERGLGTLFRICGRDDEQTRVAADFVKQKLGVKKVAILHNKTAYGQGFAEYFKKFFEAAGGQVVLFDGVASEELDFRANVTAIRASGAQALYWAGMYGQAGPLFNQVRQAGLDIPFISGEGSIVTELIQTIGPNPKGVYLTFGQDYRNSPAAQEFLKVYRARYGEEGPYAVYGYDAAQVLLRAIQTAGTTEATAVAKALREGKFETTLGTAEFDAKGDVKRSQFILWTVRDGKFVVLP
jgi:branched-chain amino acid transport system substrate-binding protein